MTDPHCEWLAAREQRRHEPRPDPIPTVLGVAIAIMLSAWGLTLLIDWLKRGS